jgi:hypothetical protein
MVLTDLYQRSEQLMQVSVLLNTTNFSSHKSALRVEAGGNQNSVAYSLIPIGGVKGRTQTQEMQGATPGSLPLLCAETQWFHPTPEPAGHKPSITYALHQAR